MHPFSVAVIDAFPKLLAKSKHFHKCSVPQQPTPGLCRPQNIEVPTTVDRQHHQLNSVKSARLPCACRYNQLKSLQPR